MDLKVAGWHGRLEIAGVAKPLILEGSIAAMTGQIMLALNQAKSRTNGEGHKTVHITFSTGPISDARVEELRRVQEVQSYLDPSHTIYEWKPLDGEDMIQMVNRLVQTADMSPGEADFWAREAFGYGPDPQMQKRVNDPKVLRFNQINASDRAASEADPHEYDSLKHYVQEQYPDYYKLLTPRR